MIAKFILFDMLNFVTPVKRVAPALFLVLVAPAVAPWPAVGIGSAAIVMSLLASNPFATDERGRLDTLYATLPMSRQNIVVGRYLALVVMYLVVAVLATASTLFVQIASGDAVDFWLLGVVNVASLLIFAVGLAVQLPFFFSLGFTRARLMTFIPATLLVGGAALASQLGLIHGAQLTRLISYNLDILWPTASLLCAAALAASVVISAMRYRRRAL
ncbi:hypothetical protein BH09ACT2_BH09ACT2_08390 [soil metagenome]